MAAVENIARSFRRVSFGQSLGAGACRSYYEIGNHLKPYKFCFCIRQLVQLSDCLRYSVS
uniref:Uncharacterized protein n=1 Tax=Rhizophora mucronata TaxID=61149 RepID=A0A2P2KDF0_RHIMU